MALICVRLDATAQPTAQKVMRQKAEEQLKDIIGRSPAVTGLVAVDLTSGETFAFNADVAFPQASAIKVPILMSV